MILMIIHSAVVMGLIHIVRVKFSCVVLKHDAIY